MNRSVDNTHFPALATLCQISMYNVIPNTYHSEIPSLTPSSVRCFKLLVSKVLSNDSTLNLTDYLGLDLSLAISPIASKLAKPPSPSQIAPPPGSSTKAVYLYFVYCIKS